MSCGTARCRSGSRSRAGRRVWYVCCYDIRDDRKRARVARRLDDYGDRVQFSVFELPLTLEQLASLVEELRGLIDPATDSVYFYPVCDRCRQGVRICGQGTAFDDEIVWIV